MAETCTTCSKPLAAGVQFCEECGTKVVVATPLDDARVRELFHQAMAMDPAQREAWLWRASEYNEPLFEAVRDMVDAAPPPSRPPSRPPTRPPTQPHPGSASGPYIGAYKLLRELGRGGMGVVYLAVRDDGAFRKNVAIKLLLQENVTPEFVQRFKQERQVLAALDHPNIARILDGGDAPDGMPYYVMEYVEGQPADEYCDKQRLSLTGRIKIFQQICQAVQYLHQNSILHRDLKPANILVSSEGSVKLLDFGIAKLIGAAAFTNSDVTSVQGQLMTPGYASPEQINGSPLQAGSDIYSLGTILYFLLTGRPPFSGYEEKVAAMATQRGPAPPSANIRQDLQATESTANLRRAMLGQLDSIVLKTLRVDPRDRYASAADLAADLQRFLDGEPVAAHHEGVASRSFRVLRRGRAAIAAGVVILLLAGVGAWQWQRMRADKAQVDAREAEVAGKESQLRALLDEMEKRFDSASGVEARVEDVGKVKKAFAQEYPAIAARRPGSEPLMTRAIRYLDRVQAVAPGTPTLGIEVADAYQQLGVLQENAASPTPATRTAALETYQKAAVTLASCPMDVAVRDRMAMLRERVQRLGGNLGEAPVADAPAAQTEAPVVAARPTAPPANSPRAGTVSKPAGQIASPMPASSPAPVASVPAPPVSRPAPPVSNAGLSNAAMAELEEDMARTESRIQTAEVTIAPIAANLEKQGQTLNGDTLNSIARMKAMLEKGRRDMASGNVAAAKESFGIARAFADKVLRTAGR